jgi:O-antigen/teichoic acid export membrane protein
MIEMIITAASIPLVLYAISGLYGESLQEFAWLAIGMLVFSSLSFVSRFALLGVTDVKNVLIFDLLGTAVKFVVGYSLVFSGFGTFGILLSFLMPALLLAGGTLFAAKRSFSFRLGDMNLIRELLKDGIVNAPSKLSRVLVLSLGIVLLALFGVNSSETGIFYIAMMISMAAGGFALNMAYMVLPASSQSNVDLSSGSLRLGLTFTAPIIAALLTAPAAILSVIGEEYAAQGSVLLILSVGVLPSIISANAISKLNNLGKSKELILIGSVQLAAFFVVFYVLVPEYGIIGAAYAMTIAFICSAIPAVILSERRSVRHISVSIIAVGAAWWAGYLISDIGGIPAPIAIVASIAIAFAVVLKLKNTSTAEIRLVIQTITRRQNTPNS